eukprot:TRINITY_DN3103_c0_g1_i1.p1 TRINITY_DN3103_c0_g1~~TRINITY_DN3103_c0_g1_i1.p1  ORF type:complete len:317 (-),score=51.16 TRINITY_DN3103_c0_g1_i1:29-916(-)
MTKLVDCPEACEEIALCYQHGTGGFEKNKGLSIFWIQRWAKGGDVEAEATLGTFYLEGECVPGKQAEGARLLRRAAENGSPYAQYNMGIRCSVGPAGVVNNEEAARWDRMAAEQGYAPAQLNLAIALRDGCGVAKNEVESMEWCRKAAEQGCAEAQLYLGNSLRTGRGVAFDLKECARWYRKAAEQGRAGAQCTHKVMRRDSTRLTCVSPMGVVLRRTTWLRRSGSASQLNKATISLRSALLRSRSLRTTWLRRGGSALQRSYDGCGVEKDEAEARMWCAKAGVEWDDLGTPMTC